MSQPTSPMRMMYSFSRQDPTEGRGRPGTPGTTRRVFTFARPYRRQICRLPGPGHHRRRARRRLSAAVQADHRRRRPARATAALVTTLALIIAALAVAEAGLTLAQRWYSARIGEGLIFDLRTPVFGHVQRMPLAFFSRTQTGALVSRLNNDVIGAQQAFTSALSGVVSNVISLVLVAIGDAVPVLADHPAGARACCRCSCSRPVGRAQAGRADPRADADSTPRCRRR